MSSFHVTADVPAGGGQTVKQCAYRIYYLLLFVKFVTTSCQAVKIIYTLC
jgi:hypothetical protein